MPDFRKRRTGLEGLHARIISDKRRELSAAETLIDMQEALVDSRKIQDEPVWAQVLRNLPENWDGENASPPSAKSIDDALRVIESVHLQGLEVESVDPDVLGGVGIYLNGVRGRSAWIAILDGKSPSVVLQCGNNVTAKPFNAEVLVKMAEFLKGGVSCGELP